MEQTNTSLIKQLQQTLLALDAELAHYTEQDERLASRLVRMHNSALANHQETLDRLLNEVFNKTQLLTSQRERVRFQARLAQRTQTTQSGDTASTPHTYASASDIRILRKEDEIQWSDVPLQTSLPIQHALGDLTLSITGLQTSNDTLRIPFQLHQSSIQPQSTEENAMHRLFPSLTGVVIGDDIGTEYVIGQVESSSSYSSYDTATQRAEQTSENVMTLAPTIPTNAHTLKITIQNVCFIPFGHHLFIRETVKVVEGPWTFDFVLADG